MRRIDVVAKMFAKEKSVLVTASIIRGFAACKREQQLLGCTAGSVWTPQLRQTSERREDLIRLC